MTIINTPKKIILKTLWSELVNSSDCKKQIPKCKYSTHKIYGTLNPGHHLLYAILRDKHFTSCFTKRTNQKKLKQSGYYEYQGLAYAIYYLQNVYSNIILLETPPRKIINNIKIRTAKVIEQKRTLPEMYPESETMFKKNFKWFLNNHIRDRQRAQKHIDRFMKPFKSILTTDDIKLAYKEIKRQMEEADISFNGIHKNGIMSPHDPYFWGYVD